MKAMPRPAWLMPVLFIVMLSSASQPLAGRPFEPASSQLSTDQRHDLLAGAKRRAPGRRAAQAAAPPVVVDVSGYDVTWYRIGLSVHETTETIDGQVTMRAIALADGYSTPTMNLQYELEVDSVLASGVPIAWLQENSLIYLTLNAPCPLNEEFEVTVFYHGHPTSGDLIAMYFGEHEGTPMILTWSEPFVAQSWWPCKDLPSDKPDSVDMIVTVNSALYAVSNGSLRDSVDNGNGTTTYVWHEGYPIATYLVSLAITDYARERLWYHYGPADADSMPVWLYSFPELYADAHIYWPLIVDQIGCLAGLFGEYPFVDEKYGMAHIVWSGAMENQTVTSMDPSEAGYYEYMMAHELGHQWWGDMVTCRDWHHIWLNEGFATYCQALWEECARGKSGYRAEMDRLRSYAIAAGKIYVDDAEDRQAIFNGAVYYKGAWLLHMIRGIVGDTDFFAILREYGSVPAHQYRDATTDEFQSIVESVSGMDFTDLFNDWMYGDRYPKYEYSWVAEPRTGDNFYNVYVHVRQTQTTEPPAYHMPIDLHFLGVAGSPVYRIWNTKREQDFVFAVPHPPTGIAFDPDQWILRAASQESYGTNLITEDLRAGTQYLPYADTLVAQGGTPPYEFSVAGGTLPAGLTLDAASGAVSGIPWVADSAQITFGVLESGSAAYKEKTLLLVVAGMSYRPADLNDDATVDALDLGSLIDYLFAGQTLTVSVNAADVNADCQPDALDLGFLIDYLFAGGALPQPGCIE